MNKCGNCKSTRLVDLFSLGNLSFTGKFPKNKNVNIKKKEIGITICKKCSLVQLSKNFDLKYLYNPDYGYRTGINRTMTNHMKSIKETLSRKAKLNSGDSVMDIASNDATLLNFYNKKYNKGWY